jgi:hypothetical protein
MAAVAVGEAQLDRGESEEYTPELAETILKDATGALHIGKEIKPDVLP